MLRNSSIFPPDKLNGTSNTRPALHTAGPVTSGWHHSHVRDWRSTTYVRKTSPRRSSYISLKHDDFTKCNTDAVQIRFCRCQLQPFSALGIPTGGRLCISVLLAIIGVAWKVSAQRNISEEDLNECWAQGENIASSFWAYLLHVLRIVCFLMFS